MALIYRRIRVGVNHRSDSSSSSILSPHKCGIGYSHFRHPHIHQISIIVFHVPSYLSPTTNVYPRYLIICLHLTRRSLPFTFFGYLVVFSHHLLFSSSFSPCYITPLLTTDSLFHIRPIKFTVFTFNRTFYVAALPSISSGHTHP